ncbi:MAG: SDR family oxidoreductase [Calditrichaeota bacterium]|nr:MAG: NAD-dependent epimerase/dehydratase family protein [Calditrichota bacterium]MBL1206371.1 SDR family oxidoreductase [Calditrichota bacterium]NOG46197.1 SDR family oxidoreductase [Calditrichota bacterium]
MSDRYLVTGGAGFIGSNLVERLVQNGENVRIIDNFSTGKEENIAEYGEQIEVVNGDIRYLNTVMEAMKNVDYVLHQAALPSVPRSVETPLESNDVNTNGTLNLLYAAKESGVKRFVMAASSSAYGESPTLPKVETMPTSPLSPYAVNKLAGENYCKAFYNVYGLETIALRYFNIYGRRQDPNSFYSAVIPKFVKALLMNKAPTIFGDGETSRDFTYIDNVIEANLLACKAPQKAAGKVMNIACGERITLNELALELNTLLGKDLGVVHADERPGDIKHSLADISLAKEMINYEGKHKIGDSLKKTVDWFVSNKHILGL